MFKEEFLITVIVPTLNEVDNIEKFISRIQKVLEQTKFQILFVDDNSKDGTINRINEFKKRYDNIDLIVRVGRRGLSGACIEGIQKAKSTYFVVIDCDLQHDEKLLVKMLKAFNENKSLDLVVGSRHVNNGNSNKGLSYIRNLGSRYAIKLTQKLLKIEINDPMSGFFMAKKSSILSILNKLQPNGFKILADILATSRGNLITKELGYEFKKRDFGHSKMNFSVMLELLGLILSHLSFGIISIRFVLFGFVGFSGVLVQLMSTYFFFKILALSFFYSHLISILITMTSNFYLNNSLTFKDHSLAGRSFFKGLISFYIVCSMGAFANIAVAEKIFNSIEIWHFASLIGALVGALWNFIFSSLFTWKTR